MREDHPLLIVYVVALIVLGMWVWMVTGIELLGALAALAGMILPILICALVYKLSLKTVYDGPAVADFTEYRATGGMPGAPTQIHIAVPGYGRIPFVVMHSNASWLYQRGPRHNVQAVVQQAIGSGGPFVESIRIPEHALKIECGFWAKDDQQ